MLLIEDETRVVAEEEELDGLIAAAPPIPRAMVSAAIGTVCAFVGEVLLGGAATFAFPGVGTFVGQFLGSSVGLMLVVGA